MTYELAKQKAAEARSKCDAANVALQAFPSLPNGMVHPDAKSTPEFKAAKLAFDITFEAMRQCNGFLSKRFKAELNADRREQGRNRVPR